VQYRTPHHPRLNESFGQASSSPYFGYAQYEKRRYCIPFYKHLIFHISLISLMDTYQQLHFFCNLLLKQVLIPLIKSIHPNPRSDYSVLNEFTGFATAALKAWKLTVINAITITSDPATANIGQLNEILYG
jgi:hypothetical protein